jgi:mannose-6-phosphate isomerase-like protein (cupin superfamily)
MSVPSQGDLSAEQLPEFWFINSLITFVTDTAATEGCFSIYRQVAPLGFATPYHTHEAYGEGFYVLEGEVTFFCNGKKTVLGEGGFIYLPGTQPHGFRVSGDGPATMIIVSPPKSTFGAFVREMGEPATSHQLPAPSPIDVARLGAVSAKYGSSILGPLPE